MRALTRYLLRCTAFLGFAVVCYVGLVALWGAWVPEEFRRNLKYPLGGHGHMYSRLKELRDHGPVDVLVVGASHAYRGFDPRLFEQAGYTAFNLGSSAQTMLQTEALLERYSARLRPGLVIIESYPNSLQVDGVESSLDLIANGGVDGPILRMAMHGGNVRTYNAIINSVVRDWLGADAGYEEAPRKRDIEDPWNGRDSYVGQGYVEHDLERFTPHGTMPPTDTEPEEEQFASFLRIMHRMHEQGTKVVLVEAPVTRWLFDSFVGHEKYVQRMAAYAPYYDMNGAVALNDTVHFLTKGHLNQMGVELFDRALIERLERDGYLPGKR